MKKTSVILTKIFAIGITLCFFLGGLSLVGYIIGIIIGGETATNICGFIFTQYFPWVIKLTSVFAGVGLLSMYLSKQKTLTVDDGDCKSES